MFEKSISKYSIPYVKPNVHLFISVSNISLSCQHTIGTSYLTINYKYYLIGIKYKYKVMTNNKSL